MRQFVSKFTCAERMLKLAVCFQHEKRTERMFLSPTKTCHLRYTKLNKKKEAVRWFFRRLCVSCSLRQLQRNDLINIHHLNDRFAASSNIIHVFAWASAAGNWKRRLFLSSFFLSSLFYVIASTGWLVERCSGAQRFSDTEYGTKCVLTLPVWLEIYACWRNHMDTKFEQVQHEFCPLKYCSLGRSFRLSAAQSPVTVTIGREGKEWKHENRRQQKHGRKALEKKRKCFLIIITLGCLW